MFVHTPFSFGPGDVESAHILDNKLESAMDLAQCLLDMAEIHVSGQELEAEPTDLWFSFPSIIGYRRERTAGVVRGKIVVHALLKGKRRDPRTLLRQMAENLDLDPNSIDLRKIKGWVSSRRARAPASKVIAHIQARHKSSHRDDDDDMLDSARSQASEEQDNSEEDDDSLSFGNSLHIDCFVDPLTLSRVIRQSEADGARESDVLSIYGVLVKQFPTPMIKLLEKEPYLERLTRMALKTLTLELEGLHDHDVHQYWAKHALRYNMPSSWLKEIQFSLDEFTSKMESEARNQEGAQATQDEALEEDEGDSDYFVSTSRLSTDHPPNKSGALQVGGQPSSMHWAGMSQVMQALAEGLAKGLQAHRPAAAKGLDTEGARIVQKVKQGLPPHLQELFHHVELVANEGATQGPKQEIYKAGLVELKTQEPEVGDPKHALGVTVHSAGECLSHVFNTVGGQVVALGLQGILLAESPGEARQAAEFAKQFTKKSIEQVAFEAELKLQARGEPPNALSSSGSMGTRRADVLSGVLTFENVTGILPLFLPPQFRLGERDYADTAELEAVERSAGARTVVWGHVRALAYHHGVHNVAADRPRAARFFIEVKQQYCCSALQHAAHAYLELLDTVGVPKGVLCHLRGGFLRSAAHLDDSVDALLVNRAKPTVQRAFHHLLHGFVVLDEAAVQFFSQFNKPAAIQVWDKVLHARDDLEPYPVFKRFPTSPGSHPFQRPNRGSGAQLGSAEQPPGKGAVSITSKTSAGSQ